MPIRHNLPQIPTSCKCKKKLRKLVEIILWGRAAFVGMMAVQIAKKMLGCKKVIGMAGTDDKCRWVEKLGADLCLNCRSSQAHRMLIFRASA